MGKISATFRAQGQVIEAAGYVVKRAHRSLLRTASDLKLITILQLVSAHSNVDAKKEFPKLFGKMGKLKNFQVKLNISKDVKPVARQQRRILFQLRKALQNEVTRLEQLDIIEKVTGPTPWVSPIVIVSKRYDSNAVRMCVDMREANTAIARERHIMPAVEDVIRILNAAAYFSKLDLKECYHQLELAQESRVITTFSTHCGLRRYKSPNYRALSDVDAGGNFTVKTDHLPLVSIIRKPVTKLSARLERLSLRLQHYSFTIEHIAGKDNAADYPSRHTPATNSVFPSQETSATEEYISCVVEFTIPKALTVQEVEKMYSADSQMQLLIKALQTTDPKTCEDMWKSDKLKPFAQIKDELTVFENDLVLRGTRLVIPERAQAQVVSLALEVIKAW
ncbi:hypothetical protein MTO96_041686 [Rhipicephalus appendiculatus]